jgi:hypothetical protein
MRLVKLKTPLQALVFAIMGLVLSVALSLVVYFALLPQACINLLNRCLWYFYYPVQILTFYCLPHDGVWHGGLFAGLQIVFIFLQLYLIFLVGISLWRHFSRRAP